MTDTKDSYLLKWLNEEIPETPQQKRWSDEGRKRIKSIMETHDCSASEALNIIMEENIREYDRMTHSEMAWRQQKREMERITKIATLNNIMFSDKQIYLQQFLDINDFKEMPNGKNR